MIRMPSTTIVTSPASSAAISLRLSAAAKPTNNSARSRRPMSELSQVAAIAWTTPVVAGAARPGAVHAADAAQQVEDRRVPVSSRWPAWRCVVAIAANRRARVATANCRASSTRTRCRPMPQRSPSLKEEGKCPEDTVHRQVKYLNNVVSRPAVAR